MPRFWSVAAIALAFVSASEPAHACRAHLRPDLEDVKYADVVLVGWISGYRIVLDREFRRRMLANPKLPPRMRQLYEGTNAVLSDYARFDVRVGEVLAGKAPDRLSVTWDNSTFPEPGEMAAGPFLIALREPGSRIPPLRGPSATILPNPEPGLLTVLQAPCSGPFIFESSSEEARAIRLILGARPR